LFYEVSTGLVFLPIALHRMAFRTSLAGSSLRSSVNAVCPLPPKNTDLTRLEAAQLCTDVEDAAMGVEGISDGPNWYVIRTGAKQEERAISNLKCMAVENLSPQGESSSSQSFYWDNKVCARANVFPITLSRGLMPADSCTRYVTTRGVHSVVSFGGVPAGVDDSIIEIIQAQIGDEWISSTWN